MTNLLQNLEIDEDYFIKLLLDGDLYAFEEALYQFVMNQIYDKLATIFITDVISSQVFEAKMRSLAARQRSGKLQKRTVNLQIRSGTYLKLEMLYARKVPKGFKGSRYFCFQDWGVIDNASPSYYSQVSKLGVLCGSFEIVKEVLGGLQMGGSLRRIRSLALAVSRKCLAKRVDCMLSEKDNLGGQRVVISTDGGRIRIRNYQAEKNKAGTHHKFETPWKEPKLFVITIIDQEGKIEKKELPIYDATFGEEGLFKLLGEYLKALNIKEAAEVQVIADGALWIWKKAKKLPIELGVAEDKIIETLDYYHAVEHLTKILQLLPKKKGSQKNSLFKELKELLWEGKIKPMLEKIESQVQHLSKKLKTEIEYFEKNIGRLNYHQCRENKWLCGSGIIESLARGRMRSKRELLKQALCGRMREHHVFLISEHLDHFDYLDESIARFTTEINQRLMNEMPEIELLDTIPGVSSRTAEILLAEIGTDMTRFPSAKHLSSWAGMCPGNNESAGKRKTGKTRKGSKWLRQVLTEAAHGAATTKNTYLGALYRRLAPRRGTRKALVAVGHAILVIVVRHETT